MNTGNKQAWIFLSLFFGMLVLAGCVEETPEAEPRPSGGAAVASVPHEEPWGIYSLDLASGDVELVYGSARQISHLNLDETGEIFAFSQKLDGDDDKDEEICTLNVDGTGFVRLTDNDVADLYPVWSPDGSRIAFLSWQDTLDIYVMDADGGNAIELYDSGSHDADISWRADQMAFTRDSQIWVMGEDGSDVRQVTDYGRAGEWGDANLPFGDYDPRISPDGSMIVFERLVGDSSPHGNYDIYTIYTDGMGEAALTSTGYSQGLASWSHSGQEIVYIVAAIGSEGRYRPYIMNYDGTGNHAIAADLPSDFLVHSAMFSSDDSRIFFVGQWWE